MRERCDGGFARSRAGVCVSAIKHGCPCVIAQNPYFTLNVFDSTQRIVQKVLIHRVRPRIVEEEGELGKCKVIFSCSYLYNR